jgi:transcriptional regulator with XRE-family HTH domain
MDLLRKLREQTGWSQDRLAAITGVDKRTIQQIEQGEVLPSLQTATTLATALGVLPIDLIQYSGLRARLRTALMNWQHQAPTPDELAALSNDLRPLVATFCEGVAGLDADEEKMMGVKAGIESLHRQWTELTKENAEDWSSIRAVAERETTLPLLARMDERSEILKHNADRTAYFWRKLQELLEHHTSRALALATVASLLDAAVDAYDVRN